MPERRKPLELRNRMPSQMPGCPGAIVARGVPAAEAVPTLAMARKGQTCRQHPAANEPLARLWADLVAERTKIPRRAVPNDGRDSYLTVDRSLDDKNPVS